LPLPVPFVCHPVRDLLLSSLCRCLRFAVVFAFAVAVACFFVCHPVRDPLLSLPLPLPVPLFVIPSGICCCLRFCRCLFLYLSSRQGSAVVFAFAVACSFICHPVRDLLLSSLLPLPVPLFVIPSGICCCLRFCRRHPSRTQQKVISTEAAHSLTVSSESEKPASPPNLLESQPPPYLLLSSPERAKELPPCGHAIAPPCI
jgi:hypothetical protein